MHLLSQRNSTCKPQKIRFKENVKTVSQLLEQANQGLHEAIDTASGESSMFIAPKIEIQLKCVVIDNNSVLEVMPFNGKISNEYGVNGDSTVCLEFKLKP